MSLPRGFAPAKVNLALHVTGRRSDGYHLLDSLAVFAGIGDTLAAAPAQELGLSVDGPFSHGVPTDRRNIVLRAAEALRTARGLGPDQARPIAIRLTKTLPHAAGLGGGSSDAAAAIRLLADVWGTAPLAPDDPIALDLGADVPVCLAAPAPMRMSGLGEILTPLPPLPPFAVVLVNPGIEVPTASVFGALASRDNPPLDPVPPEWSFDGLLDWLRAQRNDLYPAALSLAPEIGAVMARLERQPGVLHAVMSGSGATCVGLCADFGHAKDVARAIQVSEPTWWVAPAPILGCVP